MLRHRRAGERARHRSSLYETRKTFSAEERTWRRFGPLWRLNEDVVAPGKGFSTHPHGNVEIFTMMLAGRLAHADDRGNATVLERGDVQHMCAGRGIEHSELNASATEPLHLIQIWAAPSQRGLPTTYAHRRVEPRANTWCELAGPSALRFSRRLSVLSAVLEPGRELSDAPSPAPLAWLQVLTGTVESAGGALGAGDGLGFVEHGETVVRAISRCELLLVLIADATREELEEQARWGGRDGVGRQR